MASGPEGIFHQAERARESRLPVRSGAAPRTPPLSPGAGRGRWVAGGLSRTCRVASRPLPPAGRPQHRDAPAVRSPPGGHPSSSARPLPAAPSSRGPRDLPQSPPAKPAPPSLSLSLFQHQQPPRAGNGCSPASTRPMHPPALIEPAGRCPGAHLLVALGAGFGGHLHFLGPSCRHALVGRRRRRRFGLLPSSTSAARPPPAAASPLATSRLCRRRRACACASSHGACAPWGRGRGLGAWPRGRGEVCSPAAVPSLSHTSSGRPLNV